MISTFRIAESMGFKGELRHWEELFANWRLRLSRVGIAGPSPFQQITDVLREVANEWFFLSSRHLVNSECSRLLRCRLTQMFALSPNWRGTCESRRPLVSF